MNQEFNYRFDDLNNQDRSKSERAAVNKDHFDVYNHIRNLCLIWPDNNKKFFNFAYLVSGNFQPDDGCITLSFTTNNVEIKGTNLEGLFDDLLLHLPKSIRCIDERYRLANNDGEPFIESIKVT